MTRTYIIEKDKKQVLEYHRSLSDAKSHLKEINEPNCSVLAIHGAYYGEGFHKYRVYYKNGKFVKESV